jgi:hypothetical protein
MKLSAQPERGSDPNATQLRPASDVINNVVLFACPGSTGPVTSHARVEVNAKKSPMK